MPQSLSQWLSGYAGLAVDTLGQRLFDHAPPPNHPLFPSTLPPTAGTALADHVCVITGANTGIGYETARHLAALGATVILACRNPAKAAHAADAIRHAHAGARVETGMLDLSSYISVRAFADSLTGRRVDSLVLNAGVMGVPQTDPESHLVINHVAHALLTLLLLPALARAPLARVVAVSGLAARVSDLRVDDLSFATRPYNWRSAHANSKLCMLLFARALAARLRGSNVYVNAVHPGDAPSEVSRHLGGLAVAAHRHLVGPLCLLSAADAAHTSVYAAAAPEVQASGAMFCRTCRTVELPAHLVEDADVESVWELTLQMAGVTDADMGGLRALEKKAAALNEVTRLAAAKETLIRS